MRLRMIVPVTALALSSAFVALPASAQQSAPTPSARSVNDGGLAATSQTGIAQYNGAGQVVGTGNEASGGCAQRYHSFDPSTGTYLGRDGARHSCQ
jgi:hypothetical protein